MTQTLCVPLILDLLETGCDFSGRKHDVGMGKLLELFTLSGITEHAFKVGGCLGLEKLGMFKDC